jgi:ubiquinone/menaquinone biosynthesis C-methylase UbiE
MSIHHRIFCRSPKWKRKLGDELVPWLVGNADLGDRGLEIGAGPGLGTEKLIEHAHVDVALERDAGYLRSLRRRMKYSGVAIIAGDASKMPFRSGSFSSVIAIMVIHHVWPAEAQQHVINEAFRVLCPRGLFVGIDARPEAFSSRIVHCGDRILPVNSQSLLAACEVAGFERVNIEERGGKFRFEAVRSLR